MVFATCPTQTTVVTLVSEESSLRMPSRDLTDETLIMMTEMKMKMNMKMNFEKGTRNKKDILLSSENSRC